MNQKNKITIEELEKILESKKDLNIQINPDGSIQAVDKGTAKDSVVKPITFKYAVGEYY